MPDGGGSSRGIWKQAHVGLLKKNYLKQNTDLL